MFLGKFNVLYVARWFLNVVPVCRSTECSTKNYASGVLDRWVQLRSHFLLKFKLANEHEMLKIKGQEIRSNKIQIFLTGVFIFPDNFWLLLPTFWHTSVLSTLYIFKPGLLRKFQCIWGHCFNLQSLQTAFPTSQDWFEQCVSCRADVVRPNGVKDVTIRKWTKRATRMGRKGMWGFVTCRDPATTSRIFLFFPFLVVLVVLYQPKT